MTLHINFRMNFGLLVCSCRSCHIIQIIPSHLFFMCLSSLAFIGFRRGLSITYCIEEVHECKLRERTDFCLLTFAWAEQANIYKEKNGGEGRPDRWAAAGRAEHHKMHPDWCEDICLEVALLLHWDTKVTCQSGHFISSKPPRAPKRCLLFAKIHAKMWSWSISIKTQYK